MRFPWQRAKQAKAEAERARTQYEWAVQNRTTVSDLVSRLLNHAETNGIIEAIHKVAKGKA